MPELSYQTDVEVARALLRQAMRAYMANPTESNVRRVDNAKEYWHAIRSMRLTARGRGSTAGQIRNWLDQPEQNAAEARP